MKINILTDQG